VTNRIEAAFEVQRREGTGSIIPFVVGGHPSLAATAAILPALAAGGARIIEIGVPFSDPIADGPVISEAMRRALDAGATPARLFESIGAIRSSIDAALVFMVSISIVERMGRTSFIDAAKQAGIDGLVIPDLDLDEAPAVAALCRERGLTLTMLVAPATGGDRARRIVDASSGFIYLLARQGVTGAGIANSDGKAHETGAPDLARRVQELRAASELPIACGFGIASAAQVTQVLQHADAAIVGSALVRALDACNSPEKAAAAATAFMRDLSGGLRSVAARQ